MNSALRLTNDRGRWLFGQSMGLTLRARFARVKPLERYALFKVTAPGE